MVSPQFSYHSQTVSEFTKSLQYNDRSFTPVISETAGKFPSCTGRSYFVHRTIEYINVGYVGLISIIKSGRSYSRH